MKVMITAASRHGATWQLAERIAGVLSARGHEAVTLPAQKVVSVEGYAALVVGGAVYYGGWTREGTALVDRLAPQVAGLPVWAFSSGPLGDPPGPQGRPQGADRQAERLGAVEHRVFAGRLSPADLSVRERAVARMVKAPEGDFRPWADVEAWAGEIAETLSAA